MGRRKWRTHPWRSRISDRPFDCKDARSVAPFFWSRCLRQSSGRPDAAMAEKLLRQNVRYRRAPPPPHHLNRATSESELKWPDRILASPVVQLLHRSYPNPLLLQFAAQDFVDSFAHCSHCKHPLLQAQTSPSIRSNRKTNIAINAPTGKPVKATANGTRKIASQSKIRKMIAYK